MLEVVKSRTFGQYDFISKLYEKIGQLKMELADGKLYLTDVAEIEQLVRLIQSIPSPKA